MGGKDINNRLNSSAPVILFLAIAMLLVICITGCVSRTTTVTPSAGHYPPPSMSTSETQSGP